jgi:hypothetical protein
MRRSDAGRLCRNGTVDSVLYNQLATKRILLLAFLQDSLYLGDRASD